MSLKLVQALHDAIGRLPRGAAPEQEVDPQASVLVQFAAGDFQAVRAALEQAKVDLSWKDLHGIADAAGVVSHSAGGQPLPVDTRIDLAAETLPPGAPAPEAPVPSGAMAEEISPSQEQP